MRWKLITTVCFLMLLLCAGMSGEIRCSPVIKSSVKPCTKTLIPREDTLTIRVIGDVMLHSAQIESAARMWNGPDSIADEHKRFDFSTFLSGVRSDLQNADLCIANMEFTLGGLPFSGYPAFSSPDSFAEYIADSGVDVLLTANNHILDRGRRGIERTLGYYEQMEARRHLKYTGSGLDSADFYRRNPLMVRVNGFTIGIVNCTYGTNVSIDGAYPKVFRQKHREELSDAIKSARERGADIVMVLPHWGIEYIHKHNSQQESLAAMIAEAGADVIIGAHPHVVQDYGVVHTSRGRDVPVYYSIGNAVSNMSARGTQVELMVTVRVARDKDGKASVLDTALDWLWCSRPGTLCDSYMVVKESDCPPRECWQSGWEKMQSELESVKKAIR